MLISTPVVARESGQLAGNGSVDYCAELDMTDTLDGQVSVDVSVTKGNLESVILSFHAGPESLPTNVVSDGKGVCSERISDATAGRNVTFRTTARYFRASVTGNGEDPSGSDAVVTYHYLPRLNAIAAALANASIG